MTPNSIQNNEISKRHVLVVEDEAIGQIIMRHIIERAGYTCDIVDTGETALDRFKEKKYAIIFMDIGLPGTLDGIQTTKTIRDYESQFELSATPIIIVSAHVKPESFPELYAAGCNQIFSKPTNPEKINAMLKHYASCTDNVAA